MPGRFDGKQALVLGVANKRSIAWAIAQPPSRARARSWRSPTRVSASRKAFASWPSPWVATSWGSATCARTPTSTAFSRPPRRRSAEGHCLSTRSRIAAAEDLEGRFTDTPRDRFWLAVDISAYSLVAAAKRAEPLMQGRGGGSILTMTYLGGERAVPHYNVMGVAKATLDASVRYLAWDLGASNIRINAISAGPVRTLAARSIAGFTTMEEMFEQRAPLHRHMDASDCGAAAAYLLSNDGRNVTGTTLYVDAGYHAMGM